MTAYRVPLIAAPQRLSIPLSGIIYNMNLKWNTFAQCWVLDIADVNNVPIVNGLPLITGANLLSAYDYLGFTGQLVCQTDNDPQAVPTFYNLGSQGNLYYVTT